MTPVFFFLERIDLSSLHVRHNMSIVVFHDKVGTVREKGRSVCRPSSLRENRSRFHPIPSQTQATSRATRYLVSEGSELALGLLVNTRRLLGVDELAASGLLALVVCTALNLSALLKSVRRTPLAFIQPPISPISSPPYEHIRTWQQHPGTSSQPRG